MSVILYSMKNETIEDKGGDPKTVTLGLRITPESRDRLDHLVDLLSEQLGDRVSRVQAFNVAVREAIKRREGEKP